MHGGEYRVVQKRLWVKVRHLTFDPAKAQRQPSPYASYRLHAANVIVLTVGGLLCLLMIAMWIKIKFN